MDVWYFAYGSNLLRSQMERRVGPARETPDAPRLAYLAGHQVVFNKFGRNNIDIYANLAPADSTVIGAVYCCDAVAMQKLDGFEQGYERKTVLVTDDAGAQFEAVAYFATPEHTVEEAPPTDAYLRRIVEGAREFGIPEPYVVSLLRQAGRADDWA